MNFHEDIWFNSLFIFEARQNVSENYHILLVSIFFTRDFFIKILFSLHWLYLEVILTLQYFWINIQCSSQLLYLIQCQLWSLIFRIYIRNIRDLRAWIVNFWSPKQRFINFRTEKHRKSFVFYLATNRHQEIIFEDVAFAYLSINKLQIFFFCLELCDKTVFADFI